MERVCQSVQYNVSPDSVRAKGCVRLPSTTFCLQQETKDEVIRRAWGRSEGLRTISVHAARPSPAILSWHIMDTSQTQPAPTAYVSRQRGRHYTPHSEKTGGSKGQGRATSRYKELLSSAGSPSGYSNDLMEI